MDKKRWANKKVPLHTLCLKLGEEAMEVGLEVTDAQVKGAKPNYTHMLEELEHVEFIAQCIRKQIKRERKGK